MNKEAIKMAWIDGLTEGTREQMAARHRSLVALHETLTRANRYGEWAEAIHDCEDGLVTLLIAIVKRDMEV
jgi:hypothetical protein